MANEFDSLQYERLIFPAFYQYLFMLRYYCFYRVCSKDRHRADTTAVLTVCWLTVGGHSSMDKTLSMQRGSFQ